MKNADRLVYWLQGFSYAWLMVKDYDFKPSLRSDYLEGFVESQMWFLAREAWREADPIVQRREEARMRRGMRG